MANKIGGFLRFVNLVKGFPETPFRAYAGARNGVIPATFHILHKSIFESTLMTGSFDNLTVRRMRFNRAFITNSGMTHRDNRLGRPFRARPTSYCPHKPSAELQVNPGRCLSDLGQFCECRL